MKETVRKHRLPANTRSLVCCILFPAVELIVSETARRTKAVDINIKIEIPALEKLVDYVASGVGSVAGPMLATWRSRKEAEARRIAAQGKKEVLKLEAEAQAEAHRIFVSPDTNSSKRKITIGEKIDQRIQFQEGKRQRNIQTVVCLAAEKLGDKKVPNHEPDHDWTARFFNDVKDVSSEEMQLLWAKVLAGQIERPGNTSLMTLSILKNLDRSTAKLFRKLCSACVSLRLKSDEDQYRFSDARVLSLGERASQNALSKYGLEFRVLNVLNEHGLIISDYDSYCNTYRFCILRQTPGEKPTPFFPLIYQGQSWILQPTKGPVGMDEEFKLYGVALTKSGMELSEVVDIEPMEEYTQDLEKFFEGKNLKMLKTDG